MTKNVSHSHQAPATDSPEASPASSGQALRKRAEKVTLRKKSQPLKDQSPEATHKLSYDLQVHQIELDMQNEELRRVQIELEASRARYFDLYDLAPVGYLTLSEHNLITEINLTACEHQIKFGDVHGKQNQTAEGRRGIIRNGGLAGHKRAILKPSSLIATDRWRISISITKISFS
jgi:hypothetical protein